MGVIKALLLLIPLSVNAYTLQWNEPTTRADGTALYPEDIIGYLIYVDGSPYSIAYYGETSKAINLEGEHTIQMVTIDSGQRFSTPSEIVRVPIAGPNSPDLCVTP